MDAQIERVPILIEIFPGAKVDPYLVRPVGDDQPYTSSGNWQAIDLELTFSASHGYTVATRTI